MIKESCGEEIGAMPGCGPDSAAAAAPGAAAATAAAAVVQLLPQPLQSLQQPATTACPAAETPPGLPAAASSAGSAALIPAGGDPGSAERAALAHWPAAGPVAKIRIVPFGSGGFGDVVEAAVVAAGGPEDLPEAQEDLMLQATFQLAVTVELVQPALACWAVDFVLQPPSAD